MSGLLLGPLLGPVLGSVLVGCGGPGPASAVDSGPSLPEIPDDALDATWSSAEATAELQAAVALGLPQAWAFRGHYRGLLDQGDPACPGTEEYITDTFLYGCTADSGVWFAGITDYIEETRDEGGVTSRLRVLMGDLEIIDSEGQEFGLGGHVAENVISDSNEGVATYLNQIKGTLMFEGADDWYREPVSAFLTTSVQVTATQGTTYSFDGGVSYLGRSVDFRQLTAREAECGLDISGGLGLRDPSGPWHVFDFRGGCDCPEVSFAGGKGDEAQCVDLQPLIDDLLTQKAAF